MSPRRPYGKESRLLLKASDFPCSPQRPPLPLGCRISWHRSEEDPRGFGWQRRGPDSEIPGGKGPFSSERRFARAGQQLGKRPLQPVLLQPSLLQGGAFGGARGQGLQRGCCSPLKDGDSQTVHCNPQNHLPEVKRESKQDLKEGFTCRPALQTVSNGSCLGSN